MRPYLGPTVRIKRTFICVTGNSTEQIGEMESVAHLWRDSEINIWNANNRQIVAEDFQPILNSPTILQCRKLDMPNAHFSFKDYKILYTLNVIENWYDDGVQWDPRRWNPNYWPDFLEQPGVKPVIALDDFPHQYIDKLIDRLFKSFSSAVLPNAFKIVFPYVNKPLILFRETNKTSGEILELKKGIPMDRQEEYRSLYVCIDEDQCYTLQRSSIF
ncbi:hypothetical protein DdX_10002 [Ditylenchus destructor]|uniref:Uncharacterized protein n=1 Tax=Ditylenchus destructor TaxID=166010 RepID=A0AAD4N3A3_9BILA|nr:hypothetical protein DdX_10002 [Ditylenchus destructor]